MKVFITVDMEGIAGLVQWDGSDRELERRLITEEVNAAVRGAFSGGATEVFAGESHGNMRNILPELVDPRVTYLSGLPKPMYHISGIDSSFDLALFIGFHAKAGTLHGVMSHTFSDNIFAVSINGVEAGEISMDAALCGFHGVPVGLVTGDRAACEESRLLLGDVETVIVKDGVSRTAARCVPVTRAREMIEEASARAVRRASDFKPFILNGPVKVQISFINPSFVDTIEHLDFVTRIDGRTIRLEEEDFLKAFERFNALNLLAPVLVPVV